MGAVLKGAEELRRLMRGGELALAILPDVASEIRLKATEILIASQASAPIGETAELWQSAFVDGPQVDRRAFSTTATAGYTAPHAPYVHEGVHGPRQITPPKFLARALAANPEEQWAETMGDAVMAALAKHLK